MGKLPTATPWPQAWPSPSCNSGPSVVNQGQSVNQGHLLLPTLKSWLSSASDDCSFHADILVLGRPVWVRLTWTHHCINPSLTSGRLPSPQTCPEHISIPHLWLSGLAQNHLQGPILNRGSQAGMLWPQAQFRRLCPCHPRYASRASLHFQRKKKAELLEWPQVKWCSWNILLSWRNF